MNCVLGIQGKKWVMLKVSQKKGWVKYLRRRVNNVLSIPGHAGMAVRAMFQISQERGG